MLSNICGISSVLSTSPEHSVISKIYLLGCANPEGHSLNNHNSENFRTCIFSNILIDFMKVNLVEMLLVAQLT
jgi:hypothetical protein